MEHQPSLAPVALRSALGDPSQLGDLAQTESAEEMQVHQLGQLG